MNKFSLFVVFMTLFVISCRHDDNSKNNAQPIMQNEECLICGALLEYLPDGDTMECSLCHKQEFSHTRCVNGHYVCDACHISGVDSVINLCLNDTSTNPVAILEKMMSMSFCHMHGPEHHILVGSALLTAYHNAIKANTHTSVGCYVDGKNICEVNAGDNIDLQKSLFEMVRRGREVPGGACGYWGACGAAISTGMFVSIITSNTPLSQESWGLSNLMTSKALERIGSVGGPRCCKRDSYLSVLAAIDFVKEHLGVEMQRPRIQCSRSRYNNQCIGSRCPFSIARTAK